MAWGENDEGHFRACFERWSKQANRRQDDPQYRDEWYAQQCGACRFYVRLSGLFADDWGCCSNQRSPFDGRVRFEHDGCDQFESDDDE
jgi:hypothetical protein